MSFIYITGAPGVGKSTIQKEMYRRGLEVFDLDDAEFGGAHNKISGERIAIPAAVARAPEWYDDHEWRVDVSSIKALKSRSHDQNVFMCGVAPDDEKILKLFDRIFYLKLDENTLKQRIAKRKDNDYGKNANELTIILERKTKLDSRYANSDADIINANEPPSKIVDNILARLNI